jgi:predicted nuclease of predicted toxin-antitoxin system
VRILFDQGVPAPLRKYLAGHHVETAYERGWATMENSDLLAAAQTAFDLFLTTDKNLRYQQNLAARTIAIAVLPTTQWPILETQIESLAAQIGAIKPGSFVDITIS